MIKVVIDTNIFVSAILTSKGQPAKIFDLIKEDKIILLISQTILEEIRRVLLYPHIQKIHGFSQKEVEKNLITLTKTAKVISIKSIIKMIKDDPTDNKFLECAISGEADFIISGDNHLKNLKNFQGIKIVAPSEFISLYDSFE